MTLLDTWISGHVPPDDVRLTTVHFNAFRTVPAIDMVNTLDLLVAGHPMTTAHPILLWTGPFQQMQREGITGATIRRVFQYMLSGAGSLTGLQLHQFWTTATTPGGHSELVVQLIDALAGGNNTPAQITACILSFLDGTHRLTLTKTQLRDAFRNLATGNFTQAQIRELCMYLQNNLPGVFTDATGHHLNQSTRFVAFCDEVRTAPAIDRTRVLPFFRNHPNVTDAELARLLLVLGYARCFRLMTTALPGAIANVPGQATTAVGLVAYAISRQDIGAVSNFLQVAFDTDIGLDFTCKLMSHLRHMAAGDRVARLRQFVDDAEAARGNGRSLKTWANVETLHDEFLADHRETNDPAAIPAVAAVHAARVHCTAERIDYFCRAHTYRFHDFTIANRTRDDITFFPRGTTQVQMRAAVVATLAMVTGTQADDAVAAHNPLIVAVNNYEIGLIADNYNVGDAALIHFMPHVLGAAAYWHSSLVRAFRRLY